MRAAFPYLRCLTARFPANHALRYKTADDTFIKEYPMAPGTSMKTMSATEFTKPSRPIGLAISRLSERITSI
jgi:hypothetical protein